MDIHTSYKYNPTLSLQQWGLTPALATITLETIRLDVMNDAGPVAYLPLTWDEQNAFKDIRSSWDRIETLQRLARQEKKIFWSEYNQSDLYDNLIKNEAICQDYTLITGYILAQAGIPNALGGSSEIHHAFGLFNDNEKIYVYDSTSGLVNEFDSYRSLRPFNSWEFEAPWGGDYGIKLYK